jgi:hypothetical protein
MKKVFVLILITLSLLMLTSCADSETVDCLNGHTYGFWGGLWHGMIAPFDFLGMLLSPNEIAMYAPNNNGGWYALGFLFGSGSWGILSFGSKSSNKK